MQRATPGLRPTLAVAHSPAKELLVACAWPSMEQEMRKAAAAENWQVITFTDYDSLRQAVRKLSAGYLVEEIEPYLTLAESRTSPPSAFVLLLSSAISEGRLPILVRFNQGASIEEQRSRWADLETVATTTSIDRLLTPRVWSSSLARTWFDDTAERRRTSLVLTLSEGLSSGRVQRKEPVARALSRRNATGLPAT